MNVTALREIKLLRELHSPYIVRLLDVFPHKRNLLLVRAGSDSRSLGSALHGKLLCSPPILARAPRRRIQTA